VWIYFYCLLVDQFREIFAATADELDLSTGPGIEHYSVDVLIPDPQGFAYSNSIHPAVYQNRKDGKYGEELSRAGSMSDSIPWTPRWDVGRKRSLSLRNRTIPGTATSNGEQEEDSDQEVHPITFEQ